jgi:hypothetical protein
MQGKDPFNQEQFDKTTGSYTPMMSNASLFPAPPFLQPGAVASNPEKQRIADRLYGFDHRDNDVWKAISQKFGTNIKQQELLSIASVLAERAGIRLDRDAKRRKSVLVKWFDENWAAVSPYLDYVVLQPNPAS